MTPTTRLTPPRRRIGAGFTLVELLVALTLSMLLVVVMLKTQTSLAQQSVVNADSGVRDGETRNALDILTRTVSGAGFLLGGAPFACNEMFTYDLNASSSSLYFTHHPVDAMAASSGLYIQPAGSLQLNYPTGTAIPSDVLLVSTSNDANRFDSTNAPIVRTQAAPPAATVGTTPMTDGKFPVSATTGLNSGDIGVLQVSMSSGTLPNRIACFRVPITTVTATPFAYVTTTPGTILPTGYYSGFSTSLAAAGYASLTDTTMVNTGQFVDLGPAATANDASTIVFYVQNLQVSTSPSVSIPTLMMGTYKFTDDTLDTAGTQAVAVGVISLQVRFGVDPGKTGAVTAYETAAQVTSNNDWETVRTTKVLVVSRSLADDNTPSFQTTSAIGLCASGQVTSLTKACIPTGTTAMPYGFSAITDVGSGFTKRRYAVNTFEIANRNVLWNCNGALCTP